MSKICTELGLKSPYYNFLSIKYIYEIPPQIFALKNIKKGKSEVDRVFEQTLTEFKSNLLSTYSIATKQNTVNVKYKDLIANFLQVNFSSYFLR
jgi:hypothetical protein